MVLVLLALHALCAVGVLGAGRVLRRHVWTVGAVAPLAVVVWLLANARAIGDGEAATARLDWVPGLGLAIDLRVDAFASLMLVLVSGIGVLVYAYAWHYFGSSAKGARAAGLLTLFAGSMVGMVPSSATLVT